jgi:hypothetical protein
VFSLNNSIVPLYGDKEKREEVLVEPSSGSAHTDNTRQADQSDDS